MGNLLKADYYSLIKSKLTYILLGICIGLPILMLILYLIIRGIIISETDATELGIFFMGKYLMFNSFSLTNNVGLAIIIFTGIFTMSDIRSGTIRNKIIFGENRTKVYFSHLIVSVTLCVVMSLVSFIVLALGSVALFGYGVEFNGDEFLNFIRCFVIGILAFVYVASLSTFLALSTKSMPMTIMFTILTCIGLGIICGLSEMLLTDKYNYIFYLIPTYASTIVSSYGAISLEVFLFGVGSFILFIALNTFAGIMIFKKTDLK